MVRVVEAASCHFHCGRYGLLDVKRQDAISINPYDYWLHSNNSIPYVRILEGLLREKASPIALPIMDPITQDAEKTPRPAYVRCTRLAQKSGEPGRPKSWGFS